MNIRLLFVNKVWNWNEFYVSRYILVIVVDGNKGLYWVNWNSVEFFYYYLGFFWFVLMILFFKYKKVI